jgi:putative glutamine amidotransferase
MPKRPLIVVTGPDQGGLAAWWFSALQLRLAGARVRRSRPSRPYDLKHVDGVVIGGGEDVNPELYGEPALPVMQELRSMRQRLAKLASTTATRLVVPVIYLLRYLLRSRRPATESEHANRDALETDVIRQAIERRLPMLGICRGAQLINVTLGGSLHQQLDEFYQETPNVRSVLPAKHVYLTADSRLAEITESTNFRVNALHSQAVKELGNGLISAAKEFNGVVQAIEHTALPIIGVQWHPEYLPQHRHQRALFKALVINSAERCDGNKQS